MVTAAALSFAWALRFEFSFPRQRLLLAAIPVLVLLRVAALYRFDLQHGYWRYSSIADAFSIVKAVTISTAAFCVVIRYGMHIMAFPLSVYFLEPMMSILGLGATRMGVRAGTVYLERAGMSLERRRAVIIGAGFAGQMLVRELHASARHVPVAVVDDDSSKQGAMLHGVRIEGAISELAAVVARHHADEVLIAIPSATRAQMFRIVETCNAANVRYRTVPSLRDLAAGTVKIDELREINLEDLLGRQPVDLQLEPVRRVLDGKVILVTGAAGSIGSELSWQIVGFEPDVLICVDHDESALFQLEYRLKARKSRTQVIYCVEDIGDTDRMRTLLLRNEVDFVFHAAAYKHVPMMERNVSKALRNNVFALRRLVGAAEECGVTAFLLISSDKAVNPTNVMGCTKRIGELILSSRRERHMRCVSVRFGNVLGSQGSVIPLFQQQLRDGLPLTITHPDITRFFMTISEAVSLVLQGFTIGQHGDILVLDMGEPISIRRMAKALIHFSGYSENQVKMVYTGLRPGEKLYEELFYEFETRLETGCEKVFRTKGPSIHWEELDSRLRYMESQIPIASDEQLKMLMSEFVPEYSVDGALESFERIPVAIRANAASS